MKLISDVDAELAMQTVEHYIKPPAGEPRPARAALERALRIVDRWIRQLLARP